MDIPFRVTARPADGSLIISDVCGRQVGGSLVVDLERGRRIATPRITSVVVGKGAFEDVSTGSCRCISEGAVPI